MTNNESTDDFKLDLDGTCAAAHKRAKDGRETVTKVIDETMEPMVELCSACGEDHEAFWLVLEKEHNVKCACDIIRKMATILEGKISHKELCFTTIYSLLKGRAQSAMMDGIVKEMLKNIIKE